MRALGWGLIIFCYLSFNLTVSVGQVTQRNQLAPNDRQMLKLAEDCQKECVAEMNKLIEEKKLTENQLFDTFYIPIPNTSPQKFKTQYDSLLEKRIQPILDRFLEKNSGLIFTVIVDKNGFLAVHNTKFSKPLIYKKEIDFNNNRAKRIFNDKTGIAAAQNTREFLQQEYKRDTGETMFDISIPVFINAKHWGAVRFGYLPAN